MNKLWFILPLMLGCNSPNVGVSDASVVNSDATVSNVSGSGSNNVELDASLSSSGVEVHAAPSGAGSSSGVSCKMPLVGPKYYHPGDVHRFHHRRRHHVCP